MDAISGVSYYLVARSAMELTLPARTPTTPLGARMHYQRGWSIPLARRVLGLFGTEL